MGMLQLAGAVSGFGKGVGQGLQQMQSTMGNMQLLELRDEMERARMKETWGHEEGMLQKRQKYDLERDDRQHSQALDRMEQQHDFTAGENRKQRDADRQRAETDLQKQKELEDIRQQNRINELVVKEGYSQQDAARKAKEEAAEKSRDRAAKKEEVQVNSGTRLVEQMLQNQRPYGGGTAGAKLDPQTGAQLKVFTDRIGRLEDESNNVMTTKERRLAIKKEIADLEGKQNALLGIQSGQRERPPIRFPQ